MNYPLDCNTTGERLRYLEMFKHRFRLVHNIIGLWHREGLTLDEYDNGVDGARIGIPGVTIVIPNKIKTILAYEFQLSDAKWGQFTNWYVTKNSILLTERKIYLDIIKDDATWTPNWDDL